MDPQTMDKTHISFRKLHDDDSDLAYWLTVPPEERIAALETLRRIYNGYDPVTDRLQRVLSFAKLSSR